MLAQIATTEPEKPSQRRPGLDPALEAICLRMMAKRSEDRYASMAEVAEELSAYLRSDRRADDPPPPAPPREPWEDGAAATDIVSALLKGRGLTRLLQPARRLGPPRSLLKVLIGLAALLPLMAGVVVLISQRHGTARIELSDPAADVQITIDDESFEISDAGRKHRFTIGPHQMTVSGENYETVTQDFTIKRGDNEPVRVTLVPAAAAEDSVAEPAQSSAAAPRTVVANSIGMELVRIPSGSFLMGSPHSDPLGEAPERPQHRVVLSRAFEMGRHEVTVGQFGQFVAATGYKTNVERDPRKGSLVGRAGGNDWEINQHQTWRDPGFPQNDDHPVVLVSWDDAVEFCRWLSLKEGKTYRLPTEAEWEYACRGGTSTVYWTGQEPQSLKGAANVADAAFREAFPAAVWSQGWNDGFATTAPVGNFRPNPFGLYDMHGNVYEFCADFYDARLYTQRSSATDPQGPDSGKFRVVRGDSFASRPASMRSAARGYADPKFAWNNTGFRVVREVETADADLATEGEQGFRPLFNGRDLTGWMVDGVNPDAWQVDSGEIVVNGDGWRTMGFLFTQRDYSDFIFRFEFQIDERSITGVGIRAVPGEHKHFDGGSAPWTLMVGMGGSLWFNMDGETHRKPDRPAKLKKQPGEWNEMEIDLRGSHLRVTINGEQVLDCQLEEFTRTSGAVPALQRSSGRIGLEKHTGTARFRNIRIRDLAAEAAAAIDSPASPPASASAIPTDAAGDRASSATADGTTSSVADSNDAQPATGLRRFGFSWAGRASEIARAAEYTNLLLLEGWEQAGGEAELTAAGEAGLPVVLVFRDAAGALERISSLFGEHPETILGACWFSPYYRGRTPQEVEEFGTRLKAKHPELQYWGAFVEKPQGRYQIDPVPAVVDVIVVNQFYDKTPQEVLAKANDTLPGWIRKANGRPVIMQWYGSDGMGKGTISKFEPGMLRTYVDVARQFKVAGVLFSRYGDFPSQRAESLHENAQIMREIRELGEKGRFGVAQEPDEASTDGTGRRIEPGFQSLFNGKDLDGWEGSIRGFYVEDDVLVSRKGMTERIYTRNQYANFHLRFDFLLAPGAVSGIGLRCGRDADPTYYGMAIQIMDETAPQHTNAKPWQAHGSIFGVVPARPGFLKPVGEWNSQEIIANGTRIVVKVNGATVINTDLRRAARLKPADGKNHPGLLNKAGRIALLGVFGDGGEVRFRNIRIREL